MIITSIKAENVLKYEKLELANLPEKGVIAISGQNESGKSTIGETVCFALFGRTFSLSENELNKVVYWGSTGCSASLTFKTDDDNHYHIQRFLDKEGNHSAKFSRVGQEDNPIARGVEHVAEALFLVLGYEYEEFVDSFYLAQREITAPQPNSHTVKAMAGIAALEFVTDQFSEEIYEQGVIITNTDERLEQVRQELEALDIKKGYHNKLTAERDDVQAVNDENTESADTLETQLQNYKHARTDIVALRSSLDTSSVLRLFSLFLAVVFGSFWYLLTQVPEAGISTVALNLVQEKLPAWDSQHLQGLMYLSATLAGFFVIIQLRMLALQRRLEENLQSGRKLSQTLKASHEKTVVPGVSVLSDEQVNESSGPVPDELIGRPDASEIEALCLELEAATVSAVRAEKTIGREIDWLRQQVAIYQDHLSRLEREIVIEEQRLGQAEQLDEERLVYEARIEEATKSIAKRELANELLAGATLHLSQQFNNDVRGLVSRTLPLFTENRYEHLQIDENMEVTVFSGEKRDFLDLEEVSSGTQRQIMLALRLALSQELVNRSVEGVQFLFLDEPFAFFDVARTKSSLKVLPDLSDEICQIFVVAQDFPEENLPDFDMHLVCSREINQIVM